MNDLESRYFFGGVFQHGDAHAVVGDGDAGIGVDDNFDTVAAAGQGFVNGVVYDFVDEVVEGFDVGTAHVHARAAANGFQPFKNLDATGIVLGICLCF